MTALDGRGDVFRRLAARSLKLNRTRTVVSIIGIALSCALITAIFTSVATLYSGLLEAEIMTDGAWQVEFANLDGAGLERLREDPRVMQRYERVHYGDALMPKSFEGYWGRYLSVQEWPTSEAVAGLRPLPHIACGRAPRAPDEIVLNLDLKGQSVETGSWLYDGLPATGLDDTAPRASWDGALELGSTIELALGQRVFVDPETGKQAPCLYNEPLFTATSDRGDVITEYLKGPGAPASYTVVGFHAPEDDGMYDQWGSSGPGYLGFVCAPGMPALQTSTYVATDLTNRDEVDGLVADYVETPTDGHGAGHGAQAIGGGSEQTAAYVHDSLLRYQGMVDDRSIWGTLYMIAAILSAMVVVASVSLIYNAVSYTHLDVYKRQHLARPPRALPRVRRAGRRRICPRDLRRRGPRRHDRICRRRLQRGSSGHVRRRGRLRRGKRHVHRSDGPQQPAPRQGRRHQRLRRCGRARVRHRPDRRIRL